MQSLAVNTEAKTGVRAASGLVKVQNTFFIIADDELTLAAFNFESQPQARFFPLLNGALPEDPIQRKKLKPDWESLVQLDLNGHKVILAIPSGSTIHRIKGAYLDNNSVAREVDFSKIYAELSKSIPELNIEGACIIENKLKLFQRGNGAAGKNAIIDLDLNGVCEDIQKNESLSPLRIQSIKDYELGSLNGYKLDFTDACTVEDKIWFLAVAENSSSTYEDGQYYGAILGCLDSSGNEIERFEIDCATKPEGLWVEHETNRLCFYVVTDADNRNVFASLYFGKIISL